MITSVGYAGSITDDNWRRMATAAIGSLYGVDDFASWRVTHAAGDRATKIAPGGAFGLGVRDFSDSEIIKNHNPVTTGSRWDLLVAHRNWSTRSTTVEIIEGNGTKALPMRASGFGTTNDQPLALVRLAAGSTEVQEIIDLRCVPGDGGLLAFDPLARSYLDRIGTQVRIGDFLWTRSIDAVGNPTWTYLDVTPDTGWVDISKNNGWLWGFGAARRAGASVSLRINASRALGWTPGNQLAVIGSMFRPDVDYYTTSSAPAGKREFCVLTGGSIIASELSNGVTDVTLHTTFPASRPE